MLDLAPPSLDLDALAPADRALWDAMGAAAPRYSTMPTPGACHELGACRAVALMLGTPLLPWQEWVARLATERRLDDPARYRFPTFLITVPRQAGKTTIVRVILLTRAILNTDRRAFYTAQTGKDATERWADLCSALVRRGCPMRPLVDIRRQSGSARLTVRPTGSRIAPFAPTPESLHGYTPHDVAVDELFAFTEAEGADLEGAIVPAQLTLADRQLLLLSTAGSRESSYLRRKVGEGRRAVLDPDSRLGYVEHSLAPGLDPYDPESWVFHPAYGHTQQYDDLAAAAFGDGALPPGEWLRAMCNVWTEDTDPLFDMTAYDECRVDELAPVALGRAVVGVGVTADRARGAVVAAWSTPEGRLAVKLLRTTASVAELPAYLAELARRPDGDRPRIYGPAQSQQTRAVLDEARRTVAPYAVTSSGDVRVVDLDTREWVTASAQLHAAIVDRRLAYEPDEGAEPLRAGVDRALSRGGPDGSWSLSYTSPPEVIALAAALRGARVKLDTPELKIRY